MQSNIYAQKENGDLRLIAEIEGLSDPALAVDALLDEMPRLKQRQFIVIDLDNVMVVEAGDEIVQPRREINVTRRLTRTRRPRLRPKRRPHLRVPRRDRPLAAVTSPVLASPRADASPLASPPLPRTPAAAVAARARPRVAASRRSRPTRRRLSSTHG
jgi:hypothetical protein